MFARLRAILAEQGRVDADGGRAAMDEAARRLACAALMVEAARMDDAVDAEERARIIDLVRWRFSLDETEAEDLLAEAESRMETAVQWHGLAEVIRNNFAETERVQLMDMLWDIVFADGIEHPLEASLMRRIAGLLYVSDIDSGAARKRAMRRHGIAGS